jgi:hypothetical protein
MQRFSTVDPPAVIAYFTTNYETALTNVWSGVSLGEQRISSAFENAHRELARYRSYVSRWDGYRAEPFMPDVLDDASKILSFSQAAFLESGVVPTLICTGPASDGSVDVEMQVGERRVLMTVYPNDTYLHLACFNADESREDLAPLRTEVVEQWLDWLHHARRLPPIMDQNRVHS